MSLRRLIVILLILFSVLPICVVSYATMILIRNQIIAYQKGELARTVDSAKNVMSICIGAYSESINFLSKTFVVKNFIDSKNNGSAADQERNLLEIKDVFEEYKSTYSDVTCLIMWDENKNVLLLSGDAGNLDDYSDALDAAFDPYVEHNSLVMNEQAVTSVVSTATIYESGQVSAVLMAIAESSLLKERTEYLAKESNQVLFMIDEKNNICWDSSVGLSDTFDNSYFNDIFNQYYTKQKPRQNVVELTRGWKSSFCAYEIADELGVCVIVWEVDSESDIMRDKVMLATLIIVVITIFVSIISSFYMSRIFMDPIISLKKTIDEAAINENYATCELDVDNEFGSLARGYNIMITRLDKHYHKLLAAYETIEEKELKLRENFRMLIEEHENREYLAYHDTVTGLYNRTAFEMELNSLLVRKTHVYVGFIDLHKFKNINDIFGHSVGDKLLEKIGRRLEDSSLKIDIVSRIGGDEFLFAFSRDLSEERVEAIHTVLQDPFSMENYTLQISNRMGISKYPDHGKDAAALIQKADIALFHAKKPTEKHFVFYNEEMSDLLLRRNEILDVLRNCLKNNDISLNYQPKVSPKTEKLHGFEALMRIRNEMLGYISPAEFIPIAEGETDIILMLGAWALEEACRFINVLLENDIEFSHIAVNVSAAQLAQIGFEECVYSVLKESGVQPNYLELEITESILIADMERNIETLKNLRSHGIKIALDDFGTNYSSLSYLIHLPLDVLKIDKSFIDGICVNQNHAFVVKAIMDMAHRLNLKVVAEGVEDSGQVDMLRELGCDTIQGYYYSKPLPGPDALEFSKKRQNGQKA